MSHEPTSSTHPHSLRSNLIAGGAVGLLIVIISVSFGSLIFSAELSEALPTGIGLLLFSFFVITAIGASLSSYPAMVVTPQDTTIPVLALIARHIVEYLPDSAPLDERVSTVIALMVINSVIVACLFMALGRFKMGGLIRFIPYPVVGGFLAGMGALLIQGAFHSLNGIDTHHMEFSALFQSNIWGQWFPGAIFAGVLFLALKKVHHVSVLPVILGTTTLLFYLALAGTGISWAEAGTRGWLLGSFPTGNLFQFTTLSAFTHANWVVVWKQMPDLVALWLVDTIALLFSASGIEVATARDLDLNHELKVSGLASLVSGVGGGVSGFPVLGETLLARELGGTRRLVGWTIAGLCLLTLVAGAGVLPFVPKLLAVGITLFLGLELLYEWLYRSWFKFSLSDFAIIVLIVGVIATVGYLPGIGVGLLAAIVLFMVDFSRVSVIKHELSGSHHRSHVGRSAQQLQFLHKKGDQIAILALQGFIFFGTANYLLERIKALLQNPEHPVKFLLLDFRQVTGLDSSAVLSFAKLKQLAASQEVYLVLTHLKPMMQKRLDLSEVDDRNTDRNTDLAQDLAQDRYQYFPDLDRGLEWCEARLLDATSWRRSRYLPLSLLLKNLFPDPQQVSSFMQFLEKQKIPESTVLFQQNDTSDALYFLESGQISTFLTSDTVLNLRLQTLGPGTVVGEIEFFTRSPHQQTAIADQSTTLYRLSIDRWQTMVQTAPETAAAFQSFLLTHMAERLSQANEEIKMLLL